MKKIFLVLALLFISKVGFSQWTTSGANIYNSNTGFVGVGTTTPASLFHLSVNMTPGAITELLRLEIKGNSGDELGGEGAAINFFTPVTPNPNVLGAQIYSFRESNVNTTPTTTMRFATNNAGTMSDKLVILGNGNVGIGTIIPSWPLDMASNSNGTSGFQFTNPNTGTSARSRITLNNGTTSGTIIFNGSGYPTDPNSLLLFIPAGTGSMIFGTAGTESMRILSNGNLLVGKTSQITSYKLDVAGNIRANSIVVNTTGADFVFAPSYKLPSLAAVDYYVKKNHHLPGIAPASKMQANGVNLAENQTRLLQKTEELTLYLIEKDKQLKAEQSKIATQQEQINLMKQQLKAIEKQLNKKKL